VGQKCTTLYVSGRPRERERELFIHPITPQTHALLMDVGLLKFYEEGTSLRGNSPLLQQLICHWDHDRHAFRVGPISGINPWRRMFISSLGCLGGGRFGPSSLIYHLVLQERPNWHMCRDMSVKHSFCFGILGFWWSDADEFIS
jgi:hypothetical protein